MFSSPVNGIIKCFMWDLRKCSSAMTARKYYWSINGTRELPVCHMGIWVSVQDGGGRIGHVLASFFLYNGRKMETRRPSLIPQPASQRSDRFNHTVDRPTMIGTTLLNRASGADTFCSTVKLQKADRDTRPCASDLVLTSSEWSRRVCATLKQVPRPPTAQRQRPRWCRKHFAAVFFTSCIFMCAHP